MPSELIWADTSIRQRAVGLFAEYGVWDTEDNCGVLIYVNLAERKVEIVADRQIAPHRRVKLAASVPYHDGGLRPGRISRQHAGRGGTGQYAAGHGLPRQRRAPTSCRTGRSCFDYMKHARVGKIRTSQHA
ncbi:hypothetical protein LP420_09650 [Massilia sp. B-10]|nr:hypothetical protein LP420_09650 [Massilia sp. B-10]